MAATAAATTYGPARIGAYNVHPGAQLFPMMDIDTYEALKAELHRPNGQLNPIWVQGNVLLDGRNRLQACLELGLPPYIEEYTGDLDPCAFIESQNLIRRDLTVDQKAVILVELHKVDAALAAAAAKAAGQKQGGRGHKKINSAPISGPSLAAAKSQAKNARSTVGRLAARAKVSRHKIQQAINVVTATPAAAAQVKSGKIKLAQAAKQVPKPVAKSKGGQSYLDAKTKLLSQIRHVFKKFPQQQQDLETAIVAAIQQSLRKP